MNLLRRILAVSALGAMGTSFAACGDPVVGRWEGKSDTPCLLAAPDRVEFEIEADLAGSGSVCACDFDFTMRRLGEGRYSVDIDFDGECFALDGTYDCELSASGDELDCEELGEYDRAE